LKVVRFGVVGAGGIANNFHLKELSQIQEAEVVAVADTNQERARVTAHRFGVKYWYTDYMEMLERDEIDAVIVATPHPTHARIAIDAIRMHKHVMIQKPMATNSRDSLKVVEEAKRSQGLKVMVLPFVYYDTPVYDYVKAILCGNEVGKVCMADARTSHGGPEKYVQDVAKMFGEKTNVWFFNAAQSHGGVLLDLGVYSITRLIYLLGRAKKVSALNALLDKPSEVEDNSALLIEMENGAISVAQASWTQTPGQDTTSLYGTEGTIFLNYHGHGIAVFKKGEGWSYPSIPKEKEPQHTHRHFIKCILADERPIGTPEEGHHVMQIIDAAYESAKTGKTIMIK